MLVLKVLCSLDKLHAQRLCVSFLKLPNEFRLNLVLGYAIEIFVQN